MNGNKVVETQEAMKMIIKKLDEKDRNLHLVDRDGLDIIVDEKLKQLLKSYYCMKLVQGKSNGERV